MFGRRPGSALWHTAAGAKMDCGSGSSVDDFIKATGRASLLLVVWRGIDAGGDDAGLVSKYSGSLAGWRLWNDYHPTYGDYGDLGWSSWFSTTDWIYRWRGVTKLQQWTAVFLQLDSGAGNGRTAQLYAGPVGCSLRPVEPYTSQDPAGAAANETAEPLYIGYNPATSATFRGAFALAAGWKNQVLSAAAASAYLLTGRPLPRPTFWFDQWNTTLVSDKSGNGNHGTPSGSVQLMQGPSLPTRRRRQIPVAPAASVTQFFARRWR